MNPDLEQLYEATDNLINQQFYMGGSDTIIGRTPEVQLKIKNSGQIIQKFKDMFNDNLNLFLEGKIKDFILLFDKIKGMSINDLMEIYQDMELKLEALRGSELELVVLYTIVLSSIVTQIRDYHFQASIEEIKRRIRKKSKKISEQEIQEILNGLFMRNHPHISILYNISYIDALAESFNYSKVAHICKIQKSKYMNRIVELVLGKSKSS